jgi:hypothetical protein
LVSNMIPSNKSFTPGPDMILSQSIFHSLALGKILSQSIFHSLIILFCDRLENQPFFYKTANCERFVHYLKKTP